MPSVKKLQGYTRMVWCLSAANVSWLFKLRQIFSQPFAPAVFRLPSNSMIWPPACTTCRYRSIARPARSAFWPWIRLPWFGLAEVVTRTIRFSLDLPDQQTLSPAYVMLISAITPEAGEIIGLVLVEKVSRVQTSLLLATPELLCKRYGNCGRWMKRAGR